MVSGVNVAKHTVPYPPVSGYVTRGTLDILLHPQVPRCSQVPRSRFPVSTRGTPVLVTFQAVFPGTCRGTLE